MMGQRLAHRWVPVPTLPRPARNPAELRRLRDGRNGHDIAPASTLCADGSTFGRYHSGRRTMALRAEMGWLSLPGFPRRQEGRAAIQVRPLDDALFSGSRRG